MCVATVRGALGDLPGVSDVYIRLNLKDFRVSYDPETTAVDKILAALEAAEEPAKRK
ncbi:MAG: copper chaperone CopZ [Planctomycetota bacterium]|jgi:copper chaperone CopZ